MQQWLEQNEAEMRAVYRVVILCGAVWALVLLKDLHRYRGDPDIRGVEASVDQIRRDLAKIREQMEPPPSRSGVGGIIFPPPQSPSSENQFHLRPK